LDYPIQIRAIFGTWFGVMKDEPPNFGTFAPHPTCPPLAFPNLDDRSPHPFAPFDGCDAHLGGSLDDVCISAEFGEANIASQVFLRSGIAR